MWKPVYRKYAEDKFYLMFEKYYVVLKPKLIEERDILGTTFLKLGLEEYLNIRDALQDRVDQILKKKEKV